MTRDNGRYRLTVMTTQRVLFRQHYASLKAAIADAREAIQQGSDLRATVIHVASNGTESPTIAEFTK